MVETLLSENRKETGELREMFMQFMQHAAEEHSRIREEILLVAKTAHETHGQQLATTVLPSPSRRAEDDPGENHSQERHSPGITVNMPPETVVKLVKWVSLGVGVLILMAVGFALIAGREGLQIWDKVTPVIPTP